jgi:hypothetical protein
MPNTKNELPASPPTESQRRNLRSLSIATMIADVLSNAASENIEENPSHGQVQLSNPMTRYDVRSLLVEALILTEDSSEVENNHGDDDDEPSCE